MNCEILSTHHKIREIESFISKGSLELSKISQIGRDRIRLLGSQLKERNGMLEFPIPISTPIGSKLLKTWVDPRPSCPSTKSSCIFNLRPTNRSATSSREYTKCFKSNSGERISDASTVMEGMDAMHLTGSSDEEYIMSDLSESDSDENSNRDKKIPKWASNPAESWKTAIDKYAPEDIFSAPLSPAQRGFTCKLSEIFVSDRDYSQRGDSGRWDLTNLSN